MRHLGRKERAKFEHFMESLGASHYDDDDDELLLAA